MRAISAFAALLIAAALLYAGNGLQFTLLSVRANIESFSTPLIGAMMSAYYIGFIAGCRINPSFISSVGLIRTFVALASIASAAALAHALVVDILVWSALRMISGFCFAGLAMVLESWINAQADNHNRGQILSVYRIVDLLALTSGNAMLAAASPAGFHLFALISILISIALVPVALTRSSAPNHARKASLDIAKLLTVSPVAAVGVFMVGLANAGFWSVGPIFVQRSGYGAEIIAAFMSAVIVGAAIAQWPLGWASDKIDRRRVIIVASLASAAAAAGLSRFGGASQLHLFLFGGLLGAVMIPMFGLCVAHANDQAPPEDAVETNGGLLLLHGCGSVGGAVVGASIMSVFGASSLFDYIAIVYVALAAFALYRTLRRRGLSEAEKTPFTPVPRAASPAVFEIAQDEAAEEEAAAPS
ncbi:MAG: MFS transporter [Hyphococcus sp.]